MIWDSEPWKRELYKTSRRIARWREQKRWNEASLVAIEKDIFCAFYGIRKLLEAKIKLSFECRDTQTPVSIHNSKNKKADLMNWHKLDELYDLDKSKKSQMCLKDLCNSFVHSYVFMVSAGPQGFEGIWFNTDRNKNSSLFFIRADKLQHLFDRVAHDDVLRFSMSRMPDGEFKVTMLSNKIPPDEVNKVPAVLNGQNCDRKPQMAGLPSPDLS